MGLITKTVKLGVYTGLAGLGGFAAWTRKSAVAPLPVDDPLLSSDFHRKLNPNQNPVTEDVVVRRVPLDHIKPDLLAQPTKLVEAFCAGTFGGWGFEYQRAYLQRKYHGPETANQLWTQNELLSSSYPVSTIVTDHFEVVSHTKDSIIVRCGGSPRIRGVRDSDGLFEMSAKISHELRVVEFAMKSCFFAGLPKKTEPPMPWHIQWLHQQYAKLWMEVAVKNCTK